MKRFLKKLRLSRRGILIGIAIVLAVGAVLVCLAVMRGGTEAEIAEENDFEVYRLADNTSDGVLSYTGAAVSGSVSEISTNTALNVKNVNVSVGDYVNKGDLLCTFDTADIESEIESLESDIKANERETSTLHKRNQTALQKAVESKDKKLSKIEDKIDSIKESIKTGKEKLSEAVNDSELPDLSDEEAAKRKSVAEDINTELNDLQTELAEAENELEEEKENSQQIIDECRQAIEDEDSTYDADAVKEVENLRRELDEAAVYAPQNGVVTAVNIKEGMPAFDESIIVITDTNNIKIRIKVSEQDVFRITEGMRAVISTAAAGYVSGEVTEVNRLFPDSDESSGEDSGESDYGNNFYTVFITPAANSESWIIGMTANVRIMLKDKIYAYDVPERFIQSDSEGDYIFVAQRISDTECIAAQKYISRGLSDAKNETTEIYFDGISNDTEIISAVYDDSILFDGANIYLNSDSEENFEPEEEQ